MLLTGTGAITAALVEIGNIFHWSGTVAAAFNFPAIADVPRSGLGYLVTNRGTATLTLDPAGAELINGVATLALLPNESADCYRSGAAWIAVVTVVSPVPSAARFTASGTWTVPASITRARVRVWGGGAGGTGGGDAGSGIGGGGGGYAEDTITGITPGAAITITIGAGGAAGAAGGAGFGGAGGAGGTSSFGASLSATGGAAAGTGGVGSGGGSAAILGRAPQAVTNISPTAGIGGASAMGGASPGGGGNGGYGASGNAGVAGGAGLVIIEFGGPQ